MRWCKATAVEEEADDGVLQHEHRLPGNQHVRHSAERQAESARRPAGPSGEADEAQRAVVLVPTEEHGDLPALADLPPPPRRRLSACLM